MQGSIAWRNAKHSAKDYRIYFLTVVVSLSLMYAFNLLIFSREIMNFCGHTTGHWLAHPLYGEIYAGKEEYGIRHLYAFGNSE